MMWLFGGDFLKILGDGGIETRLPTSFPGPRQLPPVGAGHASSSPEEERLVDFVSFVIDDLQATWISLMPS
jgi:hypothetical protein